MDILLLHEPDALEHPAELAHLTDWLKINKQLGYGVPEIWHDHINTRRYRGTLKGARLVIEIYPEQVTADLRQVHAELEAQLTHMIRQAGQKCDSHVLVILTTRTGSEYDDTEE